jgi:hypothetical protein
MIQTLLSRARRSLMIQTLRRSNRSPHLFLGHNAVDLDGIRSVRMTPQRRTWCTLPPGLFSKAGFGSIHWVEPRARATAALALHELGIVGLYGNPHCP